MTLYPDLARDLESGMRFLHGGLLYCATHRDNGEIVARVVGGRYGQQESFAPMTRILICNEMSGAPAQVQPGHSHELGGTRANA